MEFNVKSRERLWIVLIAGIVGLVVIVVAGYLVWQSFQVDEVKPKAVPKAELPRMANLPPKKEAIPPPRLRRTLLMHRRWKRHARPCGKVYHPKMPWPWPTLYRKALSGRMRHFFCWSLQLTAGMREAALAVARYYDPTDKEPSGTIRKNPESAYDWYTEALAGGQENAKTRLAQLRSWVEEQANPGLFRSA